MTSQLLFFLLITAFVDCLNPTTIITQLLLLIKTRSSKISFVFITSTCLTYLLTGILLFFGIATPLKKWFSSIHITQNIWMITMEIILIILGVIYLTTSISNKKNNKKSFLQHLTPWTVFLLGIGSTLSDVPTAIPYFAFIAKMEQSNLTMVYSILLFGLYTLIYISPLLVIQLVFIKNESFIIKHSDDIEQWIDFLGKWIIRLIIILLIVFLIIDVVSYFLGMSSSLLLK